MTDLEALYKKETGNDASYTKTDEWNASRTHTWYNDSYVDWLEEKALRQADSVGVKTPCATYGCPGYVDTEPRAHCPKCLY